MTDVEGTTGARSGDAMPDATPADTGGGAATGLGGAATEDGIATPGTGGRDTGLVAAEKLGDVDDDQTAGGAAGDEAGGTG